VGLEQHGNGPINISRLEDGNLISEPHCSLVGLCLVLILQMNISVFMVKHPCFLLLLCTTGHNQFLVRFNYKYIYFFLSCIAFPPMIYAHLNPQSYFQYIWRVVNLTLHQKTSSGNFMRLDRCI
jgi:hypothetical protein